MDKKSDPLMFDGKAISGLSDMFAVIHSLPAADNVARERLLVAYEEDLAKNGLPIEWAATNIAVLLLSRCTLSACAELNISAFPPRVREAAEKVRPMVEAKVKRLNDPSAGLIALLKALGIDTADLEVVKIPAPPANPESN